MFTVALHNSKNYFLLIRTYFLHDFRNILVSVASQSILELRSKCGGDGTFFVLYCYGCTNMATVIFRQLSHSVRCATEHTVHKILLQRKHLCNTADELIHSACLYLMQVKKSLTEHVNILCNLLHSHVIRVVYQKKKYISTIIIF